MFLKVYLTVFQLVVLTFLLSFVLSTLYDKKWLSIVFNVSGIGYVAMVIVVAILAVVLKW